MLPYILKICGFRNSSVYTFHGVYQKYTVFVKLYICGLTYRLSGRYKHKLRIDVITYIPNKWPSLCCCLSTTGTAIIVPPAPAAVPVPGIPTSGHQASAGYPFYCTGTAVYFALMVDPWGGFVGWDPCCCNQQS